MIKVFSSSPKPCSRRVSWINEDWWYFDLVPGEFEIRLGEPIYTGQVCVIGKDLDENTIKELFLG